MADHAVRGRPPRASHRPDRRDRDWAEPGRRRASARSPRHADHRGAAMPWPTTHDDELFGLIDREVERQNTTLQLIASENFTSPAVLRATGSVLTNKYSEGYPGKRYYGGNEVIDQVEDLARERAKALFGAEHANVQPHAGANANMAVYLGAARARRHRARPAARPGRPPHPRLAGQRQRPALPLRVLRRHAERRAHRPRPGPRPGARAPAQAHRHRRHRLPAHHRPGAVPGHRRRGRGPVHVRRRPHRRADRRRRPPQPGRRTPTSSRFTTHKTLRGPRGGAILGRGRARPRRSTSRCSRVCRAARSTT